MKRTGWGLIVGAIVAVGCGGDDESKQPPSSTPTSEVASNRLDANARQILEHLVDLETQRDVTCWTSFRQLDWFIAEKQYDEFGTLAKIRAMKSLVRAVWAKAAKHGSSSEVTAADVDAVLDLPDVTLQTPPPGGVFTNNVGVQNFSDYQKTAEHWRLVLSVVEEEIAAAGDQGLPPLQEEALAKLANASTTLSLMLLKETGKLAEADKSPVVTGKHVEAAHQELVEKYGLKDPPRKATPPSEEEIIERLQPLTRDLIAGKAKALHNFNKGSAQLLEDLNRVSRIPLDAQALDLLKAELKSFTRFVTAVRDVPR